MTEQYNNVCTKIIEKYSNLLSKQEIIAINKIKRINDFTDLENFNFINKIIDRIWNMTLTNPQNFIQGEPFIFLVSQEIDPIKYDSNEIENLKQYKKHSLKLITDKSVVESLIGMSGMIVEIDYINSFSDWLLPCDFIEKNEINSTVKLNIKGVYNLSLNLKDIFLEEELTDNYAKLSTLDKIHINKGIYNYKKTNQILTKDDKKQLSSMLIVYYMCKNKLESSPDFIKKRDNLIKKTQSSLSN